MEELVTIIGKKSIMSGMTKKTNWLKIESDKFNIKNIWFDEGSNFTYKNKKVSIELTSVFNYLINNRFVKYGAEDEARTRDPLLGKEIFYHWTTSAIAYINYNTI